MNDNSKTRHKLKFSNAYILAVRMIFHFVYIVLCIVYNVDHGAHSLSFVIDFFYRLYIYYVTVRYTELPEAILS